MIAIFFNTVKGFRKCNFAGIANYRAYYENRKNNYILVFLHSKEKVEMCVLDATSPNAAAAANSVSADSAVPALEKSIYDPDSLDLNTTVNSSAGEPSTADSTGEMPPAQSVTAISSPANK